jgi:hypothetical protein
METEANGHFKVSLSLEVSSGELIDLPVLVTLPNEEEKSVQAGSDPLLFNVVLEK